MAKGDFFRGGYRSNAYFQLKNENVLVVISTFNEKKCLVYGHFKK